MELILPIINIITNGKLIYNTSQQQQQKQKPTWDIKEELIRLFFTDPVLYDGIHLFLMLSTKNKQKNLA